MTSGLRATGRLAEDVPLGPLTTYKFGGPAKYLITVEGEADLVEAYSIADEEELPVVALGRGSNVVVADDGFEGIVLVAGPALMEREIGVEVVAGSGVPLPVLARESARAGRGGLEFYTGVPGSVGGAVRMNAGCHGSDTRQVLVTALVFDRNELAANELDPDELGLEYRHSDLDDSHYVLRARFRTEPIEPFSGEAEIRRITRWRKEHQPGGTLNAGSVFKNPQGDSAGRIIDAAGLKGLSVGDVSVSERHANFFVAGSDATASDVFRLVGAVQKRIADATGIDLEPEVRFIGDFS